MRFPRPPEIVVILSYERGCPMKEDVKKKDFSPPSERCGCRDLHPAPFHFRKGDWCGCFGSSQIAAVMPTPVACPDSIVS